MNIIKRICNWYFSRNALPYWCILALDCTAVFISGLLVTYLEHGGLWLAQHFWPVTLGLLCSLIVFIIAFAVYHTFRGVMRYSSFVDLTRLALSTATSCLVVTILHVLQNHLGIIGYVIFPNFREAVLLFIVATSIMCALRIIVKSLHDTYCVSDTTRNIFIYGCLSGGIALAKSVRIENPARFRLKGFISGDQQMDGSWMLGVPVYYDDDKVVEAMVDKGPDFVNASPESRIGTRKVKKWLDG